MTEQVADSQDSDFGRLLGQEYLTFSLGEEHYAVDILKVQEIRGYGAVTKIANAPAFIKGVINLRGVIVPIIDLRIKFNVGEAHYDEFTIVIVLHLSNRVVGIVVDGVSDVVSLGGDQIKNPPDFSANFDSEYILGLATVDEQMLIIVDIEKLMSSEEMALVDKSRMQAV
ncbi:chemotaxis protein CheW [Oceanospirillum sediminis]|uniref:Chemotaxis protein CheW n=1 Tax=Oceanospirillum sediminis TaxID=2760088 RepID=A0A839IQX3_9GAMM|nr:chemotaxis protein CheW [Oceanospirillum sediminis]MBB1486837.1 chemotaxis protein CheW [Oceanospirillum sediminis]